MTTATLPIRFVDRAGRPSDPFGEVADAIPVVDIVLAPPKGSDSTARVNCVALVDTGADYCSAFDSVLDAVSAPSTRSVGQHTAWGSHTADVRDATILAPAAGLVFHTDVSVRESGCSAYSLILGRCLLQFGVLVMDYPSRRFEWQFTGPRTP